MIGLFKPISRSWKNSNRLHAKWYSPCSPELGQLRSLTVERDFPWTPPDGPGFRYVQFLASVTLKVLYENGSEEWHRFGTLEHFDINDFCVAKYAGELTIDINGMIFNLSQWTQRFMRD